MTDNNNTIPRKVRSTNPFDDIDDGSGNDNNNDHHHHDQTDQQQQPTKIYSANNRFQTGYWYFR